MVVKRRHQMCEMVMADIVQYNQEQSGNLYPTLSLIVII